MDEWGDEDQWVDCMDDGWVISWMGSYWMDGLTDGQMSKRMMKEVEGISKRSSTVLACLLLL